MGRCGRSRSGTFSRGAQLADERLEVSLLRDEFADLHLGTVNHCLWNAPTTECQNQLPPDQRGQTPLLGACQPTRCRNSVLTLTHERIWRMEEADLVSLLAVEAAARAGPDPAR